MKLIYTLFLSLVFLNGYGQIVKKYEPAILEVTYNKHVVKDTLKPDEYFFDTEMVLRMGRTASIWVSPLKLWADSLRVNNFNLHEQLYYEQNPIGSTEYKPLGGFEREYLFKNMPTGQNTVYQGFDLGQWIYSEEIETQSWSYLDSISVILGYECYLAECVFRGRRWYAWYTLDIPIPDGPWKLGGLPGLILDAYDSKQHYRFTAKGMTSKGLGDVGIYIYKVNSPKMLTREEYLIKRYNYITSEESLGDKLNASGAFGLTPTKSKGKRERKEKYDFEEVDYRHPSKK
ncbi:GLPGLI family protein [Porphyromonas levii]|nr:GLPGLI family protein [Porphyromonas levii]MBR8703955.1 hypothetical protein [Porphyromonas levii]MBR8713243.1 hypothetical protein [Porphyromonas levii]MBR8715248.1 hypothetical protein [Porphyromonas levii]MBR8727802.1 hypothetical protein [Porphyromonas levii]MBR8729679.1 hypothetical protein [Porphyromonas levii]